MLNFATRTCSPNTIQVVCKRMCDCQTMNCLTDGFVTGRKHKPSETLRPRSKIGGPNGLRSLQEANERVRQSWKGYLQLQVSK